MIYLPPFLHSSSHRAVPARVYSKVLGTQKSSLGFSPVTSTPGTAGTPSTTAPNTTAPHKRTLAAVTEEMKRARIQVTLWTAVAAVLTTSLSPTAPYTPAPFPPRTVLQSPTQTSPTGGMTSTTAPSPLPLCPPTAAHRRLP